MSSLSAVPIPAEAIPSNPEPSPKNDVALTTPTTLTFSFGLAVPNPTLKLLSAEIMLGLPKRDYSRALDIILFRYLGVYAWA